MNRTYIAFGTALLAVLAFIVIMTPGAQAQQASAIAGDTSGDVTVTPFGAPVSRNVPIQIEYTTASVQPTQNIQVQAQVGSTPSWLTVSVSPATRLYTVPPQAAGGDHTTSFQNFQFVFSASGDAPAIRPTTVNVDFVVTAADAGQVDTTDTRVSFTVTADYYSIIGLQLPSPFLRVSPTDTATFPLEITNSGNGETLIVFEVTRVGNDKWQVPTPSQTSIQATQTGAESNVKTVNIQVTSTLGTQYYNDIGVVEVKLSPFFAPQPDKQGVETFVSFLAHFQGVYVPGFEAVAVFGALGAAGVLARSRRVD